MININVLIISHWLIIHEMKYFSVMDPVHFLLGDHKTVMGYIVMSFRKVIPGGIYIVFLLKEVDLSGHLWFRRIDITAGTKYRPYLSVPMYCPISIITVSVICSNHHPKNNTLTMTTLCHSSLKFYRRKVWLFFYSEKRIRS